MFTPQHSWGEGSILANFDLLGRAAQALMGVCEQLSSSETAESIGAFFFRMHVFVICTVTCAEATHACVKLLLKAASDIPPHLLSLLSIHIMKTFVCP